MHLETVLPSLTYGWIIKRESNEYGVRIVYVDLYEEKNKAMLGQVDKEGKVIAYIGGFTADDILADDWEVRGVYDSESKD